MRAMIAGDRTVGHIHGMGVRLCIQRSAQGAQKRRIAVRRKLARAACGRIVYRIFELEFPESGRILLGNLDIHSKNLYKNLTGCKKAVLLGATLGPKVDLLLRKYSIGDMARVVTLQACAAAMLEEYLDEWQTALEADMKKEGYYIRPRFSPGYGDFDIAHQDMILLSLIHI